MCGLSCRRHIIPGTRPRLPLLHHDDAAREWTYDCRAS